MSSTDSILSPRGRSGPANEPEERPAWYVLRVRPRHEQAVERAIAAKGGETLCPTHTARHAWSDRVKLVETPVFPGYVFCRMRRNERRRYVEVPGVIQVVGFGRGPEAVPDEEIESLRRVAASGLDLEPVEGWRPGRQVRVIDGPLAGAGGFVEEVLGRHRLVVTVSILQRAVAVEIDARWLAPAAPNRSES